MNNRKTFHLADGSTGLQRRSMLRMALASSLAGATALRVTSSHAADQPSTTPWLLKEAPLDAQLPIIDAHQHLVAPEHRYLLEDYLADASSGHNIVASVCVEARVMHRAAGPDPMKPVGETEFFNGQAAMSASGRYGKTRVAQGIVPYADLTQGAAVREVLEAHLQAGGGRVRGIRHMTTYSDEPALASIYHWKTSDVLMDANFRAGFAQLAPLGLSFDAWLFHTQHEQLLSLARAFPETMIVVDHLGGLINMGSYASRQEEVRRQWTSSIRALAACPNVHMKLGGLGLRYFGLGFKREDRPGSEALAHAWRPFIETGIEAFGPARCMFESNFPNDKVAYDFGVGWNAFKRITRAMSADERQQLFSGTARRFYRLPSTQG